MGGLRSPVSYRWASRVALPMRVLALIVLIGCAIAGEGSPTALPPPTLEQRLVLFIDGLAAYPRWYGPVLAVIGLVPLFRGWRLIRWTMALGTAAVAGGAVLAMTVPETDPALAWTAAVSVAIIAGVVGYFLFQTLVAMQGALLGFMLVGFLIAHAAPQAGGWSIAGGLVGGALGFMLGWKLAPYLGIVESVIYAYVMILAGMIILCRPHPGGEVLAIASIVGLVTIVPGLIVQLREHAGRSS